LSEEDGIMLALYHPLTHLNQEERKKYSEVVRVGEREEEEGEINITLPREALVLRNRTLAVR
jgi:hypothetical protein